MQRRALIQAGALLTATAVAGTAVEVAGTLTGVHDDGVGTSVRKSLLDRVLNVLTEFRPARHLHEVMSIESDVSVFDHGVPNGLGDARKETALSPCGP